jgi:uncharacterized protein DUF6869
MSRSAKEYADAWIAYWRHHESTGKFPDSDDASDVWDLACDSPTQAFDVILEILRQIEHQPESELFQVLAAGPVEDVLGYNGEAVIEKVESAAARDPSFKLLLGGVWKNRMPHDIWERVQQARGETW